MATVLESLNAALHQALTSDKRVFILGEDVLDPYGGAFKVTRGLSDAFPERVLTTPISEAGFVGLATGMALRGLRPVVEIMFGDFITLAADQVINHATKFRWMYAGGKPPNKQVSVPLVIRTPMGGRRGYGPTHSQTLEKLFLGVPGLRVLAPSTLGDPGKLLTQAILHNTDPLLFVENKLLYLLPVQDDHSLSEFDMRELAPPAHHANDIGENYQPYIPTFSLKLRGAPPPILTLATYGYMVDLARQAILRLAYEDEIFIELVSPTQIAPFQIQPVLESVEQTGRLLTVEEGGLSLGWGSEILSRTAESLGARLRSAHRLAASDLPIPASGPLERAVLPDVEQIVTAVQKMV